MCQDISLFQDSLVIIAPVPDVTIFIPPGNLYVGAPLTLTCDIDFDSSIASDVNVTVTWLRETSLLLNATDYIFIASSLSESQFTSNLTLDPLSTADATNFTCRAEIVLSDDFTSLTASSVGEETVWVTVEGELLTDHRCHISTMPVFLAPIPDVTIFIPPGNLYVGALLTMTCDVDFDSSIASDVNVTVTWLRETSLLLNATTENVSILSSLSESQFTSNLTLDPLSTADATNFTCRAEIVLSDDFTSLTASNVGEETVWVIVEGELLTDHMQMLHKSTSFVCSTSTRCHPFYPTWKSLCWSSSYFDL